MRSFLILPLLFLPFRPLAQAPLQLTDSAGGRALPYATIACTPRKWVTMTDSAGRALIPDSLRGALLEASFVGFRPRLFRFDGPATITMAPRPMEEVRVYGCKTPERLLLEKKGKVTRGHSISFTYWATGAQMAVWVANPSGQEAQVSTMGWGIKEVFNDRRYSGYPNTPVRLRFYRRAPDGSPGEEVTPDDIRVSATQFGWFETDLSRYRIPFPADGLFVVFELIVSGDEYLWRVRFNGPVPPNAITEVYGYAFAAHRTNGPLMYFKTPTGNWKPMGFSGMGEELEADLRLGVRICR